MCCATTTLFSSDKKDKKGSSFQESVFRSTCFLNDLIYFFFFFKKDIFQHAYFFSVGILNHTAVAGSCALLLQQSEKRVLGVFIFDNRPAYPWRQGSELEQAVGGVGVLTTRAGGGGGRRY